MLRAAGELTGDLDTSQTLLGEYRGWRDQIVARNAFSCEPVDFQDSREWSFVDGFLRHRTGGFFSLGGIRAQSRFRSLHGCEQLIILQPETAINGFLVRPGEEGSEVLFQGRIEPGNIDALQLAPTVQSTEANYKRLHGGGATPMVEWFLDPKRAHTVFDELQSEEGTRYFGKYNQNIVRAVPRDTEVEIPGNFRWYGLDALRQFCCASNVLNTDSRSVLSCMSWALLSGDAGPFTGHAAGSWGAALRRSYEAVEQGCERQTAELFGWLARLRVRCALRTQVLPIAQLRNWVIEPDRIRERERVQGFSARQFRVNALHREVSGWDQPLIDSDGVGHIVLACQERAGVLHFLLKASCEIGFLEGVQLSATVMAAPGARTDPGDDPIEQEVLGRSESGDGVRMIASCRQSEEGGRFYRDENDYLVLLLDPAISLPASDFYRWLTLGQIRKMIEVPGTFSMELRGVLVLLLRWL